MADGVKIWALFRQRIACGQAHAKARHKKHDPAGAPPSPSSRRAIGLAMLFAAALILVRAFVFVGWEQAYFDSDQAVFGLMAKHLAEGRTIPLFMYGQKYMLALCAWTAAPFVHFFGCQVFALRIPLLGINFAVAALLLHLLTTETRLLPWQAFVAVLPFLLPPVVTASRLVENQGGNIEPFLFILLLYLWRHHPWLFGFTAGIGFLNREFTAYGIASLLILEWLLKRYRDATFRRSRLMSLGIMLVVVVVVRCVAHWRSPTASGAPWPQPKCPAELYRNTRWLLTENLPTLLGLHRVPLERYGITSRDVAGGGWLPAAALLLLTLGVGRLALHPAYRHTPPLRDVAFPVYLLLVGLFTVGAYVSVSPFARDYMLVRYTLLFLFVPIGGVALLQRLETSHRWRAAAGLAMILWVSANLMDHVRLAREYLSCPPLAKHRALACYLEDRGIRYGIAPYWTAYHVDFLSGEHLHLTADSCVRISQYDEEYHHHRATAVRISLQPVPGATRFLDWYVVLPPASR